MYVWSSHIAEYDQPGKVANPARGQLNREHSIPCPRACLRIWSHETGSAAPSRVSLLISILRLKTALRDIFSYIERTVEESISLIPNTWGFDRLLVESRALEVT